MLETALKIIYNKITKNNVNCPYCWDNVSEFSNHLTWCEYFNSFSLLGKLLPDLVIVMEKEN